MASKVMKIATTTDGKQIGYLTRNDVKKLRNGEQETYEKLYDFADHIAEHLDIDSPDLTLYDLIKRPDPNGGEHITGGVMFTKKDIPGLENNVVILSLCISETEMCTEAELLGSLAHEMRHIWQEKHAELFPEGHAFGFDESLNDPKEIDADGYAIAFLSTFPGFDMENSASIICPEEKKSYPEAYFLRLKRAKEIIINSFTK